MGVMEGTRGLKEWRGEYSFAVDAGAQGTITLRSNDGSIPAGSIVFGGYLEITTSCLSATGTMALQVEAAEDILATSLQAALVAGRYDVKPDCTGTATVKTTVARDPKLVIATADFTAGIFSLVLFYN